MPRTLAKNPQPSKPNPHKLLCLKKVGPAVYQVVAWDTEPFAGTTIQEGMEIHLGADGKIVIHP